MKRRNAILLGLSFLLVVAGYVAWCWRPFYLPAKVHYHNDSPQEVAAVVEQWRKDCIMGAPTPFDWRFGLETLRYPWRDYRGQADLRVTHSGSGEMECQISSGQGCFMFEDRYVRKDGKWIAEKDPFSAFP